MKINILIPFKEKFDKNNASSVSITVKNNLKYSIFKKYIRVFGTEVENPISEEHFFGIKPSRVFFKSRNMHLAKEMLKIIKRERSLNQIIEIHNRPYVFNFFAKKLKDCSLTLFLHNDPLKMKGSKTINERLSIIKNASAIYCVSQFIKNKFEEGINQDSKKIHVLHNGVDRILKLFPKKNKEILFVGRLVPEKGVGLFVQAVEKLALEYRDWKFYICGSAFLGNFDRKSNFASDMTEKFNKIGKQANFTGFLSNNKIKDMMKKASIVVVPSLWEEPFGLVVAEAMSSGSAIITTNKGGIPEIIKSNGIIIDNINLHKLILKMRLLMKHELILKKYQKLAWVNFSHTSKASAEKLDTYRKAIINSLS